MEYIENMTFEEASKALIDELNADLATLHQNYHVEQSDWNKLYDQIANVVSEETHLPVFSPEVMEVRPRELDCSTVIHTKSSRVCRMRTRVSCCLNL